MFPDNNKVKTNKEVAAKIEKQFLGIDKKTKYLWWKEQVSFLFVSASQVTEIKLVAATDGSLNVYARVDLRDRFEYFLIDNKRTLATAKKLAEEFIELIQTGKISEKKKSEEKTETKTNLDGAEALTVLMEDLKN